MLVCGALSEANWQGREASVQSFILLFHPRARLEADHPDRSLLTAPVGDPPVQPEGLSGGANC